LGFRTADLSDENRTSPNKLTAAFTDSKGALVSISPISVFSASIGSGRAFVPIFAFACYIVSKLQQKQKNVVKETMIERKICVCKRKSLMTSRMIKHQRRVVSSRIYFPESTQHMVYKPFLEALLYH
jgi:hypothetical protein